MVYGDLVCLLYTSGTTGVPKGVKITRKSIVNLVESYLDNFAFSKDDVYGLFSNIGFDAALLATMLVLYSGACLSVIPNDIRLNINALNNYFIKQNVSHTLITTQVAKLFIKSIENTSLEVLLAGGEKLGEVESPENYLLFDAYGPTEACVFISSIKNTEKIDASSIGPLTYNTKAYILDREGRRVPWGAVGELCIAGYQIADGYLNREEETRKVFIDNPFDDSEEYSVLYRSGDLARLLPDGSLGIIGRRDSQVKIRGNRVELSEVESVIRELDYVDDVSVQTIKNNENNELVAYVVISEDMSDEVLRDNIQSYVGDCKPEYMIPSFVITLDNIPLNINGKVDKRLLPEVDTTSLYVEYVAPTNETEKQIINAFEAVFNQKGIGLYDDFIRLGGDSISAIRVISLLEKESISCSARVILNYKTPYLIAQNVEKTTKKSYDATEGVIELLPIQNYFFDQINDNEFSQEFILKSKIKLDLNFLQKTFDKLSNIHDMLRATYRYENNEVIQEILPLNTRVCEIKEYTIDNLNNAVNMIIKESKSALDIGNELIKISLVHYGDEDYLVFVIHHLIIDGVSWNILIDDLTYLYENSEMDLLRPYPYKSWVEDVKSLVEDVSDEEKQHWIEINDLLNDVAIKGQSKGFTFNIDVSFDIDNRLMLSEEEYLALSIARAYKKTYGEDIIFNRESYGRDEIVGDVSQTIGWFTSQYPVLVNVDGKYDLVSLMNDIYSIKNAFDGVKYLGLNYGSLIYNTHDLEFKHCPVTFNFLSSEFIFENKLFESPKEKLSSKGEWIDIVESDTLTFGISLNISSFENYYVISGNYADGTYLSDKFSEFVENIKSELKFIGNYDSKVVSCCLSESQLGVYLDEKVHDKNTAYSSPGIVECSDEKSIGDIKNAINKLIDIHPILKGRIVDGQVPLLICDSYPSIVIFDTNNYSELIKPFDLNKSLARFFIIDNDDGKFIFYDMHHIISDATSRSIINKELNDALNDNLDGDIDLGFVHASNDSFKSQFDWKYEYSKEFFNEMFVEIDDVGYLLSDIDGSIGKVTLPIRGIRNRVESFVSSMGITVGSFLNSIFAYTYSRFIGHDKVYYNFTEHGRHEYYSQDALGMFVRTIPIIVDCKNDSINDYVSNTSDLILKAMENSIYPFRLLANEFNLNNDVIFEYNSDLNDLSDIGDDILFDDDADSVSEFLCVVNDLDDGFVVSVNHLNQFSQNTAERFVNVFKEVLVQFLDKQNLMDINYICESDVEILNTYNETDCPLEYNDILEVFNENLDKFPNNKLISYNDNAFSYCESAFIADKIGKKLLNLGVESGDCVGFLTERSELYMLSVLGILSIGGVYVPLDDKLPDGRVKYMLKDTESKVLIVSDETYVKVKNLKTGCQILNISDIINEEIGTLSKLPIEYNDVACILYTSGTTGVPKGVKITRKSILNVSSYYVDTFDLNNDDVYGLFSSIGFDVSNFVIAAVLYSGACLSVILKKSA